MNTMFSFEQTPWELTLETLRAGDRLSAVRFLTLLEGEDEEQVEQAFADLEALDVTLDITDLSTDPGTGETAARLALEEKLVRSGDLCRGLEEQDPLRLYLEELAATPVCGDVRLLAANARENGKALVDLSLSRVLQLAGGYTGRGVLLMDLIQEGSVGLWQGILRYTGDGEDFEELRDRWICRYLDRAVVLQARESGVGRKMRQALEDYRAADRKLLTQLGRNPTAEEIALQMGVSGEDAQIYEDMLRTAQTVAKAKAPEQEPDQEDAQAVEDTAYFQSRQRIQELLSVLTEQETKVVSLRFGLEGGLPCTPQETGAKLGMTADEVVAMEAAALAKLRKE